MVLNQTFTIGNFILYNIECYELLRFVFEELESVYAFIS